MPNGNQTTLLNEVTLPELVNLVRRSWVITKETIQRTAAQCFIVEQVGAGQGNSKRYQEVDTETYADNKNEGTNFSKANVGVGYSIDMTA